MRYRRITYSFFDLLDVRDLYPARDHWQMMGYRAPVAAWWQPPADVWESGGDLVVRVELGGVDEDDFQVELYSDGVVIQGVRRPDPVPGDAVFHAAGLRYGPFRVAAAVPWAGEAGGVEAHYERGILTVRLSRGGEVRS
jgi:HSP20 family molecular chaperone IbpA